MATRPPLGRLPSRVALADLRIAKPVDVGAVQTVVRGKTAERGYGGKWQRERLEFLARNPLCVYCQETDRVTAATVVDHRTPHRGDMKLFWDRKNWQPLCKPCHDSRKQREERQQLGGGIAEV